MQFNSGVEIFSTGSVTCKTSGVQGLNSELTFLSPYYQMLILNFNRPPSSHFFSFFAKVVHPLKIYQNIKFHGLTLTVENVASTSKV
jgi:hypothetical protein